MFELNIGCDIVFAAGATAPLFGASEERLVGVRFFELLSDEDRRSAERRFAELGRDGRINDLPIVLKGSDGRTIPAVVAGFRTEEFDGHYFLAVKILGADPVDAGLPGETTFSVVAAQRIGQLCSAGASAQVSLVRLKKFKELAESLGAADKQRLLTGVATVLRRYSVGGDTAGQIDGESFGYLHGADVDPELVNVEIEEEAQKVLPSRMSLEARSVTLAADGDGLSEEQVARALVFSMQQFCTNGSRLTVRSLTDALEELASGTMETVKYFQEVSRSRDFELFYMPICDLRLGRIHHFEALSRFRDEKRAKSTFHIITLAENLGLIHDFDFAVLEMAIQEIKKYSSKTVFPPIAINISSLSLGNDAFVQRLYKRLDRTSGLNRRLIFELTESAEIKDLPRTNAVIQALRSKRYTFSLDDFGAGAASFDYLNAFEIDMVKFDGPVVRRACGSKRGHDLLSTMAKMCKNAGIQTVAEMVEDKNIANQVFYCGIDYGQGWYFGRPSPDPLEFEQKFVGAD